MNANWNYPTAIRVGPDRLSEIGDCCLSLNLRNPLLITDPGIKDFPFINAAVDSCKASGLECGMFSDVQPNPTGTNIEQGVTAFNSGDHDGVIAIGGGSALDAGKAIALMAKQDVSIW
ncbi:MAG: iron-containing alcohol dehydrogenase, partial [Arenicellales bacterium]|nr:iron-containing alcohol dehydrogenase [Arenicellales bacterium]